MYPWQTRRLNAYEAVTQLGLTPALVLDPGDVVSYTGSGTSWVDLSGNSRTFTVSGATFTGAAGGLTGGEYWALDGNDYASFTNDTFMNGLHKDAATWSIIAAVYVPNLAGVAGVFSTCSSGATTIGAAFELTSTEQIRYRVGNGSSLAAIHTSTAAATASAWNVVGLSISENGGASGSFSYVNGTAATFNANITSPSSSNASTAATFGALNAGGSSVLPNGSRLGPAFMFASAITTTQADALRSYLVARYP